ncbi:Ig-like domain-containing protein, partial [Olleya sp. AS48]|uniref:Ig-like domain-containing protein n=1 Tax=Olleya sp. AS48 TaxID=3135774 RepID=UPI00317E78FB
MNILKTNYTKRLLILGVLLISFIAKSQTQSPSIQSGVTFQWFDNQNAGINNPATIKSVTVNGSVYSTFVVPTSYEMTILGPDGNNANKIFSNGGTLASTSNDPNWNIKALSAFQDKNLNHYFSSSSNGQNICSNFSQAETTNAQRQTIFYSNPIPSNQGGILAVTERGGNNCFYVEVWGIPPGGGSEQQLGNTFVRNTGDYRNCTFGPPAINSDYWKSGRCNENGQTIGIGLFYLNSIAPQGSKITKIEFVGATRDHGDGKFFLLQKYAVDDNLQECINTEYKGNLSDIANAPTNSSYSIISGPSPAGQSFTFNPSNGSFSYVPTNGFTGNVTFQYQVCLPTPNQSVCDSATITLTYNPLPPAAVADIDCNGVNDYSIIVDSPLGSQYQYSVDNGAFQSSPVFNGLSTGNHSVLVLDTNTNCQNTNATNVTISDPTYSVPATNTISGCNANNINASNSVFPYSTTQSGNIISTFNTVTGYTTTNSDNIASITYKDVITQNSCPIEVTRTFTMTDFCGITSTLNQIITIQDTTPPFLDTNAFDFTVQCDENSQNAFNNWLATNGSATATDTCGAVTWSNNYSGLSDDCGTTGSTTVTFTATDACGNTSTTSATFTIEDTVGPTFDGFPADNNNDQPSCVGVPVLSFSNYTEVLGDGNNNTFLQGEKFRYTNVSPGVDAIITILATVNTTVPLLDDNSSGSVDSFRPRTAFSIANNGDRAYVEYQIDFIDNSNNQPTPIAEFYTTYSDIDGNTNFGEVNWTQFTNSYTVNDPTDLTITEEGPWIVATAGTTEYTGVTNIYPQANITTRNTNTSSFKFRVGVVARKANVSGSGRQHNIEFACISNYTNPSTISDEITIECSDLEDAEVLTATDNCSDTTVTFNEIRTDGDCPNTYTLERTWIATDDCGNETTRTLTINVQDTTPPTFVETLPENIAVDGSNIPDAAVLTATDNCGDAIVTFNEEIVGDICTGNQTITREWIATDACDLTTSHTQVITVNQPVLTASIDSVTNILCSTEATGTINIAVSGGSLPYTYSIDGGTTYTSNATINDLAAGNYSIIVLDANECSTTLSAEILSNCTDAIADINNTFVGQAVSGNVLTNDEDFEGDIQTVTANTNPANGSVTIDAAGNYTYTPNAGFTGEDTFTYTICDDGNPQACDTATVYIEVLPESGPENEAPIANADTATTPEGTPVDIVVLANDFDPDADPIIITNNTTPDNGTVTVNTDGTITYTPNDGFIGEDTFEYTICDNALPALCDTATVTVTVQPDGTPNTTNAN